MLVCNPVLKTIAHTSSLNVSCVVNSPTACSDMYIIV